MMRIAMQLGLLVVVVTVVGADAFVVMLSTVSMFSEPAWLPQWAHFTLGAVHAVGVVTWTLWSIEPVRDCLRRVVR